MSTALPAHECAEWRRALSAVGEADCSYLPEYHLAYSLRIKGSRPLLWRYESGGHTLLYPFLLTPVEIAGQPTGYHDITSIYGYTGPLATSESPAFLTPAWQAFDAYASRHKVVAEFVRFSPFNRTERFAHPHMQVEANRTLATSQLPDTHEELLRLLGAKTRNMLRKAEAGGMVARELSLAEGLAEFRALYADTMQRNNAPEFFWYDDAYWNHLLALAEGELRLFGVFSGHSLVAAAMAVAHGQSALYHLGASISEYARLGAGNLSLFAMSCGLMASGVRFINMTGGRTTADNDPLLLFKKSNATGTVTFYIGKRIIDADAYAHLAGLWHQQHASPPDPAKIVFWR